MLMWIATKIDTKINRSLSVYDSPSNSCAAFILFMLWGTIITIILGGCGMHSNPLAGTGFYFDTVIGITIYDKSKDADSILEGCFSIAEAYENMLSKTIEGSDVWKINHAGGKPVSVSDDTIFLLRAALRYAELSSGKADPTVGAVSALWDFTSLDSPTIPSEAMLKSALLHVNYKCISISGHTVTLLDPAAEIDLGFIAKGYIADRMKDYLLSQGVSSALINLGGNVLTVGTRPDNTPFRIGIQEPFADTGSYAFTLPVRDQSVVSSGIYERYFEMDGRIYHHILDTKTGYPVWNNLFQVTILSDSSMDGDALSTTCFVLGLEDGMSLIESLEDTEAVFITADGEIHASSGLSEHLLP